MKTSRISIAVSVFAALTLFAGCASTSSGGAAPSETAAPAEATDNATIEPDGTPRAFWAPGGTGIVLSTYGSGSAACTPTASGSTADGQAVTAEMVPFAEDQVCTMDYRERVSYIPVDAAVDRTKAVTLTVSPEATDATVDLEVAPLGEAPAATDGAPQAGLTPSGAIVIISAGSSTCPPVVSEVSEAATGITVTFDTPTTPCTRDLVTRATLVFADATTPGTTVTLVGLEGAAAPMTLTVETPAG